jgi:myo-inositol-1(or 4)-monophosphatase
MSQPTINIALKAARRASSIILQYYERRKDLVVHEKGHLDFVTQADKSSEQCLVEILSEHFPEDAFLTEESGSLGSPDAERVWIIDPLDGTANFIRGYPHFAISIALSIRGKVEHGLIYHPLLDYCYSASRGHGARLNDRRMRVSECQKIQEATIGFGLNKDADESSTHEEAACLLLKNAHALRRMGSCALELANVACGGTDAYWANFTRPWDVAAGLLLVQEAGGVIANATGGVSMKDEEGVLACNPKLLKSILSCVHHNS